MQFLFASPQPALGPLGLAAGQLAAARSAIGRSRGGGGDTASNTARSWAPSTQPLLRTYIDHCFTEASAVASGCPAGVAAGAAATACLLYTSDAADE